MKRRIALAGALALVLSVFVAPVAHAVNACTVLGDTLIIEESGDYALTLQMAGDTIRVDHAPSGVCQDQSWDVSSTGIDVVEVTQYAGVTFLLDDYVSEEVGDWASLTFDLFITAGGVNFDAAGVDDWVGVDVSVDSGGDFVIEHGDGDLAVAGDVTFVGSDEHDTFDARTYDGDVVADGGDGNDVLYGGDGDDTLTCLDSGYDQCWGSDGDDQLAIGRGDTAAPGDGDDDVDAYSTYGDWTLTYADSSYGITYDKEGYGDVRSSGGDDDINGDAPQTVIGSRHDDEIIGDDEDETLIGGEGRDLIRGHEGQDRISGDSGDDTLYGGRDSDTISGGDGDDDLYGRRGNDLLRGDAGRDRLYGGEGRDVCGGEILNACER